MEGSARGEFRLGWGLLIAATIGVGLGTTGAVFYSFGLFVKPLAVEFGWQRGAISSAMLFFSLGSMLVSPFVGRAVEQFGARRVAVLAQAGLAVGFCLASLAGRNVHYFQAVYFAISLLGAGTSPIVWTKPVAGHFARHRGLALGLMLSGTGLAAILAPLVVGHAIAGFGWRAAYRVLAACEILVGIPVTLALLRDTGMAAPGAALQVHGIEVAKALRSFVFWRLVVAFLLIALAVAGPIVHLPIMLADRGMSPGLMGLLLGGFGYAVICGRLVLGYLMDRLPPAATSAAFILLASCACLLLSTGLFVAGAVILLGLCAGAEVDMLAFLVSRVFGLKHYAAIYGCVISAFVFGAGVGPVIAGSVHDVTGSYQLALLGFAAATLVAAGLIFSLRRQAGLGREAL